MEQDELSKLVRYLEDAIRDLRYAENDILFAIMQTPDNGQPIRSILYENAQGLEETRGVLMNIIAQHQENTPQSGDFTVQTSAEATPFD